MKTLYAVRHAKSSWKDINLNDIDRPLKKRGKTDAQEIAQILRKEGVKPDMFLTSPALRAYDTARIFAEQLMVSSDQISVLDKLYLPDFPTMLKLALYMDDRWDTVFVFGHEPSLSAFINYFIQHPLEKVITSSVTRMEFDTKTWKDLAASTLQSAFHRNRHDWEGFELK